MRGYPEEVIASLRADTGAGANQRSCSGPLHLTRRTRPFCAPSRLAATVVAPASLAPQRGPRRRFTTQSGPNCSSPHDHEQHRTDPLSRSVIDHLRHYRCRQHVRSGAPPPQREASHPRPSKALPRCSPRRAGLQEPARCASASTLAAFYGRFSWRATQHGLHTRPGGRGCRSGRCRELGGGARARCQPAGRQRPRTVPGSIRPTPEPRTRAAPVTAVDPAHAVLLGLRPSAALAHAICWPTTHAMRVPRPCWRCEQAGWN